MHVTVHSEPTMPLAGREVRPDVVLEITPPGQALVRYVIDAKFRDYNREPPLNMRAAAERYGSLPAADRLGTIRDKYLRLDRVRAGAIVHPDPRRGMQVFDDAVDRQERGADVENEPHRCLSVCWSPGSTYLVADTVRLLTCFLAFHEGKDHVCWQCGKAGRECTDDEAQGITHRATVGTPYRCEGCKAFWVSTRCYGCGQRPLIKSGHRSFHRVAATNPYDVCCPWCTARLGRTRTEDYAVPIGGQVAPGGRN